MNGILVVDKPEGFTSFDVVAKLRGLCGTRKIGHGGTLDPMATGVLPVFIGTAAKAVDLQPLQDKCYEATMLLGTRTDTGDITGTVLEKAPVTAGEEDLLGVLNAFLGQQQQVPPMYSAIKIQGKPLYKYAREGKEIERKARTIVIREIEYKGSPAQNQYTIWVHCTKGTYIRTLVEDIGAKLGLPATLTALRRTHAGMFALHQAHTLPQLQQAKDEGVLPSLLLPVETVFAALPRTELEPDACRRVVHGAPVWGVRLPQGRYTAFSGGEFIGLVHVDAESVLRGEKLFYREAEE